MNGKVTSVPCFRKRTKIGKPLGDSKFIKKMEKLSGKKFTFRKNGRPKKENK